jgi:hypothetical protein
MSRAASLRQWTGGAHAVIHYASAWYTNDRINER